jgi:hypothetical protein
VPSRNRPSESEPAAAGITARKWGLVRERAKSLSLNGARATDLADVAFERGIPGAEVGRSTIGAFQKAEEARFRIGSTANVVVWQDELAKVGVVICGIR